MTDECGFCGTEHDVVLSCDPEGLQARENIKALAQAEIDRRRRVENFRIEALRAASRVVAGRYEYKTYPETLHDTTLTLAKQFARWLEEG